MAVHCTVCVAYLEFCCGDDYLSTVLVFSLWTNNVSSTIYHPFLIQCCHRKKILPSAEN